MKCSECKGDFVLTWQRYIKDSFGKLLCPLCHVRLVLKPRWFDCPLAVTGCCIAAAPLSYWGAISYGYAGCLTGLTIGVLLVGPAFSKYLRRFSTVVPEVDNRAFKRDLKEIGSSIGTLLVLTILAPLIMNVIFGHEFRQTMAKLKAEGRALTVAEFRPAPIPDDQNAAPLIIKAVTLITNAPAASAIKELSDLIITNNAVLDIAVWPAAHREALPRLIQTPEMQQLFTVISEASQKPGYNCYPKYEEGPEMLLPNLSTIRAMARFLSIRADLAAQNGNGAEAFATVLEGLKLANLLRQEPIIITMLVSINCDRLMIDSLERILNSTDIPADKTRSLIAELERHTDPAPMIRCMDGERVGMGIWIYNRLSGHASYNEIAQLFQMAEVSHSSLKTWFLKYHIGPLLGPWLKRDFNVYLKLMSEMQDYFKAPYYQVAETIRDHPTVSRIPRYCFFSKLILPALDQVVTKNAEHDAAVDVARVGLGLKLFKQKNGAYPDTLDKLAPEFLENIPVDPFTGKALIYLKDGDGFMLYSLGPNQRDDNGTPKPTDKKATGKEPYDIVWKCAR